MVMFGTAISRRKTSFPPGLRCNIGAYFSGIASGSLHGWLWLVAAFAGSVLGTRLRAVFELSVERSSA